MPDKGEIIGTPCDFEQAYEQGRLAAVRELERRVLGCDYGGTSWTTRTQIGQIIRALKLSRGTALLEVGAGSGWPGLYLAELTGCDVMLVDLPVLALRLAAERAAADGLESRCHAVAASGAALPFRDGSFDAISHSDVLCCMPEKLALLRECRRVGRAHASMHFSVILAAPRLAADDYQVALEAGPPFVAAPRDYAALLSAAGWQLVRHDDVTAEYLSALTALVESMLLLTEDLVEALGEDEFAAQLERRRFQIQAVESGLLKRETFAAAAGA